MKRVLLWLIGFYRKSITPYTPPSCRFTPSCSAYAQEAITRYGARKGCVLACKRLCRCHPFYKGSAYDPVPILKEDNHNDVSI